jgi:hypothetical protein
MSKDLSQRVKIIDENLSTNSFENLLQTSGIDQDLQKKLAKMKRRSNKSHDNMHSVRNAFLVPLNKAEKSRMKYEFYESRIKYN